MTEEQEIRVIALEQAVKAMAGLRDQSNYQESLIVLSAERFEIFIKGGLYFDE